MTPSPEETDDKSYAKEGNIDSTASRKVTKDGVSETKGLRAPPEETIIVAIKEANNLQAITGQTLFQRRHH